MCSILNGANHDVVIVYEIPSPLYSSQDGGRTLIHARSAVVSTAAARTSGWAESQGDWPSEHEWSIGRHRSR